MDHRQLSMIADKVQWVFSESLLNACGTDVKFCRRMRTITPFRLGLALTATWASQRVETLADFYRGFNALFQTTIPYKVFPQPNSQTTLCHVHPYEGRTARQRDDPERVRLRQGQGLCGVSSYRHPGREFVCHP